MYKFKEGFRVPSGIDAETVKNELDRIREKYGILTSSIIVDESRSENSVLHSCFLWDDAEAGERYRKQQASTLTRSIVITQQDQNQERTVFFLTVKDEKRQYAPVVEIQNDPEMYDYTANLLQGYLRSAQRAIDDLGEKSNLTKAQKAAIAKIKKHVAGAIQLGARL